MRAQAHRIAAVMALVFIALIGLAGARASTRLTTEARIADIVARATATFYTLWVAVGIVKDGKVFMAKGYDVRQIDKPDFEDAKRGVAVALRAQPAARDQSAVSLLYRFSDGLSDDRPL